jgi:hypothetical protein
MVVSLGIASGVSALEWGIESATTLQSGNSPSPPSVFTQEVFGTLTVPLGPPGSKLEATAHVLGSVASSEFGADFDVLDLIWALPKPGSDFQALTGTIGRFALTDPSGLILNHSGDGLKLAGDYKGFDLSLWAAYTGFVNRSSTSGILMTLQDEANSANWFDSPRLIASLEVGVTLFTAQRVTLGALAQYDMNSSSNFLSPGSTSYTTSQGGSLNTQYFTFKAEGPIAGSLLYKAFGTLGTGSTLSWVSGSYQYEPILAFLLGGELSYYFPGSLEPVLKARVLAASGDPSATSAVEGNIRTTETLFQPITASTLGTVFSPALSNLIDYEIGGSLRPWAGQGLVTGIKFLGFQRQVAGVVNASDVLTEGPVWIGEELDLTGSWQVYSDFIVSASLGGFVPNSGTYPSGSAEDGLQYALELAVDLKL